MPNHCFLVDRPLEIREKNHYFLDVHHNNIALLNVLSKYFYLVFFVRSREETIALLLLIGNLKYINEDDSKYERLPKDNNNSYCAWKKNLIFHKKNLKRKDAPLGCIIKISIFSSYSREIIYNVLYRLGSIVFYFTKQ
jgi:hypothetical protein